MCGKCVGNVWGMCVCVLGCLRCLWRRVVSLLFGCADLVIVVWFAVV